jgi:hypothetical protein
MHQPRLELATGTVARATPLAQTGVGMPFSWVGESLQAPSRHSGMEKERVL